MKFNPIRLEFLADVIDPHPSHRAPKSILNGFPFAGIGDISENGEINIDKARSVEFEIIEEHEKNYVINDFSIGYGRVGTVGKVVKLRPRTKFKYELSPTLAVINPKIETVNPRFLFFYLTSTKFFNEVSKLMTGSTRQSIGIQLLRKLQLNARLSKNKMKRTSTRSFH